METDQELRKILEPGEKVLWAARPDPMGYIRPSFIIYIVAIPWTIFTIGWLWAVTGGFKIPGKTVWPYSDWIPWLAVIAGFTLLIAGLWMLSAPYWVWRRGKRTIHAITEQRALIVDTKYAQKNSVMPLNGKVTFRITDPTENVSDLDIICGSSKGLLFRAVQEPRKVVELFTQFQNL